MGTRKLRLKQEKNASKIKITILIMSLLLPITSIGMWIFKFLGFKPFNFITLTQFFYLLTIGIFFLFTALDVKLLTLSLKSFIKIFFNVWLVSFILISTKDSIEQNIYIIYTGIIFGYLEALLEIYDFLNVKLEDVSFEKFKYIDKNTFKILSRPIAVSIVSIIHFIVAFPVSDFIKGLYFPK